MQETRVCPLVWGKDLTFEKKILSCSLVRIEKGSWI